MSFDKIVATILKESNHLAIPALDGQPEMYLACTVRHDPKQGIDIGNLRRLNDGGIAIYNQWHMDVETDNFEQAVDEYKQAVKDHIPTTAQDQYKILQAYQQLQQFKDVVGTFKFQIGKLPMFNITCLWFFVNVNTEYYYNLSRQDTPFKDFNF